MRKMIGLSLCLLMMGLPFAGCYTVNHTIGTGGDTPVASDRQWYVLWGLVPITNLDGGQMAKAKGLTNNYTIQTQANFLDDILNMITGIVSVWGQTITVLAPAGSPAASAAASASPGGAPAAPATASKADPYINAANQLMANKDYPNALKYYQAAVSLDPNSAVALQGEGSCYYYMGQKDQARDAFTKALALNPSNTSLQNFVNSLK
jgi:hypothetical protein